MDMQEAMEAVAGTADAGSVHPREQQIQLHHAAINTAIVALHHMGEHFTLVRAPGPKSVEFPRMIYRDELGEIENRIVENQSELDVAIASGWRTHPTEPETSESIERAKAAIVAAKEPEPDPDPDPSSIH